jgi:hypothetical protein
MTDLIRSYYRLKSFVDIQYKIYGKEVKNKCFSIRFLLSFFIPPYNTQEGKINLNELIELEDDDDIDEDIRNKLKFFINKTKKNDHNPEYNLNILFDFIIDNPDNNITFEEIENVVLEMEKENIIKKSISLRESKNKTFQRSNARYL